MLNNKGQLQSVIIFVVLIVGLLVIAPIAMKVINAPLQKFGDAVATISPVANSSVNTVQVKTGNLFDYFIMSMFLLSTLILIISAFLVDVHPVFLVFYIIGVSVMFLILPSATDAVKVIWGVSDFSTETAQLGMTGWVLTNFWVVMLGVVFISGVIMFAKFRLGGQNNGVY